LRADRSIVLGIEEEDERLSADERARVECPAILKGGREEGGCVADCEGWHGKYSAEKANNGEHGLKQRRFRRQERFHNQPADRNALGK
jgi:hypothetical protein